MKHLTEHQVAGFLDHALPPDEHRVVEAHLEACADCRRELVTLSRALVGFPGGHRSPRLYRWLVPVALAAGIAALLVVPRSWIGTGTGGAPAVRSPALDGEREARIPIVSPGDDVLTNGPIVFRWRPVTADMYRVSLLADDGRPLWSGESPGTSLQLPDSVALQPGHAYFWRVDAIANGIVASTGVHRLTITP